MGKFGLAEVVLPAMALEQTRNEIVRLVHRGLGVPEFSVAAARAVGRTAPFDGFCLLTIDPATALPTGEVVENALGPQAVARLTEIEISEPDYNKFTALARAARPAASLGEATAGHLDRSLRQRELRRPAGFADELRAVLVSGAQMWGALTLLRGRGRRHFTRTEVRRVASLTGLLAEGMRRALLVGRPLTTPGAAVGLILLARDNSVEQATPAAWDLLDELGCRGARQEQLPIVIQAVANRALGATGGRPPAEGWAPSDPVAQARVRTQAGRWLAVYGCVLGDGPAARRAVIIEPAAAPALAPLIAAAYGLTERERQVAQLVAQGRSTAEMAGQLHLSAWTVQDHLKAIFAKTGAGTRGELVARLF